MEQREKTKGEEEREIDLREVFFALWRRKWRIILVTVAFMAAAWGITEYLITPIYVSSAKIYVLNRQNQDSVATNSDLYAATQLVNDAKGVVTSRSVLEQVQKNLNLNMSASGLDSMISVGTSSDTRILTISVSSPSASQAQAITDELVKVSCKEVEDKMGVESMNIVDSASLPTVPSSPSKKKNMMLAGAIGFVLSCALVLLSYFLNDKIKTAEDIERYLGMSCLGMIPIDPDMQEKGKKKKRSK